MKEHVIYKKITYRAWLDTFGDYKPAIGKTAS